jgi:hypothetical protein
MQLIDSHYSHVYPDTYAKQKRPRSPLPYSRTQTIAMQQND